MKQFQSIQEKTMAESLFHLALLASPEHPAVAHLNLTWNDLRKCFAARKMNTQLFTRYFDQIRYWNWPWISEHVQLDDAFIYRYCRHIDWVKISRHQRLTVDVVAHFETDISWEDLSANPHLTFDIIGLYATRLDWGRVCKTIVFDENQINQFRRYIDWYELSLKSPMREKFIEDNSDRVFWPRITAHQVLTDDFIDRNRDRVDWDYISRHRPMDRTFIEDHADYVDWGLISDGQELSEQFILDHKDKLDWEEVAYVQDISEQFFEDHAPRTQAVWAAFTAGRTLTLDFIRRHITRLPARELTRYQTFTLAELDEFADHLDWGWLAVTHSFEFPETGMIDLVFIHRHAHRFTAKGVWGKLIQTHNFPVDMLVDLIESISRIYIEQDIQLADLRRHPELANEDWIAHNCPLTVEYLEAARPFIFVSELMYRHLPREVIAAFPDMITISELPINQPPMPPEWIELQTGGEFIWAAAPDIDPRNWPLYSTPRTVARFTQPSDEFFRRNQDLILSHIDIIARGGTHILLKTMASIAPWLPAAITARVREACAFAELHVPSSWDFLEQLPPAKWEWLVSTFRLSEALLRRFQHKVNWSKVSKLQQRPFSEQFVREFHTRLNFKIIQLPYDVTPEYMREFGAKHNWQRLTPKLQEWQMELYQEYCNYSDPPRKNLSEKFIADHYSLSVAGVTQPISEAFIHQHGCSGWAQAIEQNKKVVLSQRFRYTHFIALMYCPWTCMSNQSSTRFTSHIFTAHPDLSEYSILKLAPKNPRVAAMGPVNLSQVCVPHFWSHFKLSDQIIRRFLKNVNWRDISRHQKLDKNFLAEFKDKVDWCAISQYQTLSEKTIRQFQDYVIWPAIWQYQKVSESFITEFEDRVSWEAVSPYSLCY